MSTGFDELCSICCENEIYFTCSECQCKICKQCLKHYTLSYANLMPHCLNCSAVIPISNLYDILEEDGFESFLRQSCLLLYQNEQQKIPECLECCKEIKEFRAIKPIVKNIDKILPFIQSILNLLIIYRGENPTDEKPEYCILAEQIVQHITETLKEMFNELYYNAKTDEGNINQTKRYTKFVHGILKMGLTAKAKTTIKHKLNKLSKKLSGYTLNDLNSTLANTSHNRTTEQSIINKHVERIINKNLGKSTSNEYLFRCSNGLCKGFVRSNYYCELCDTKYCEKCLQPINTTNHICKQEDIETAKIILNSTKPCPNCAARIFKIDGCSQMFCTNCHAGFDWNTGTLIKTSFHNPHRIEYIQTHNGVEPLVLEHGRDCNVRNLKNWYAEFFNTQIGLLQGLIRAATNRLELNERNLYILRVKYALNDIDDEQYNKELYKHQDYTLRFGMLNNIYQQHIDLINSVLFNMMNKLENSSFTIDESKLVECFDFAGLLNKEGLEELKTVKNDKSKIYKLLSNKLKQSKRLLGDYGRKSILLSLINKFNETILDKLPIFDDNIKNLEIITNNTCDELEKYKLMFGINEVVQPDFIEPTELENDKYNMNNIVVLCI